MACATWRPQRRRGRHLLAVGGVAAGALLAAGIPLGDGFRRPKAGLAAETRRHNDKEKKRRKRERIGELVRAVRHGPETRGPHV